MTEIRVLMSSSNEHGARPLQMISIRGKKQSQEHCSRISSPREALWGGGGLVYRDRQELVDCVVKETILNIGRILV